MRRRTERESRRGREGYATERREVDVGAGGTHKQGLESLGEGVDEGGSGGRHVCTCLCGFG